MDAIQPDSDTTGTEQDASLSTDSGSVQTDAHTVSDASIATQDMMMQAHDSFVMDEGLSIQDTSMSPDATSPCPDAPEQTCESLCEPFGSCLISANCLGLEMDDEPQLQTDCENTCGFNTGTRQVLCAHDTNLGCSALLEGLFQADQALDALCNPEGDYSQEQRTACREICQKSSDCNGTSDSIIDGTQTCDFQCLASGAFEYLECIRALECGPQFSLSLQACVQNRVSFEPLVTGCDTLCLALEECTPSRGSVFSEDPALECVTACASRLETPAAIACAGLKGCALETDDIGQCQSENQNLPTCDLACRQVQACYAAENPFGVTAGALDECVESCQTSDEQARTCSFSVACDEEFSANFESCIEADVQE